MKLSTICGEYFTAYRELGNWNKHDMQTKPWIIAAVASYFTVIAPLLVLATYGCAKFGERIQEIAKPSPVHQKIASVAQSALPVHVPFSVVNQLGGYQELQKKIKGSDPQILMKIRNSEDVEAFKYAFLAPEDVAKLTLQDLPKPLTRSQLAVLLAQLKKLEPSPADRVKLTEDTATLSLQQIRSSTFSLEEVRGLMDEHGAWVLNLLPEEQVLEFIAQDVNENGLHDYTYKALFDHFDVEDSVYKNRVRALSNERAAQCMKKYQGAIRNDLSPEQTQYYFQRLKAADLGDTDYRRLFYRDSDGVNKARFQAIPKEEVAEFMKKFRGEPRDLLSPKQTQHYFQELKAANVDETFYRCLFYRDSDGVNKARFQAIPKEEVAQFMKKFKGEPRDLLSQEQTKYYFQQLKAADVDETLYKRLFYRDFDKVNEARFQAIPIEEAAEFMKKFKGEPKELLSSTQAQHYFQQLKAADVDETLYKRLFYRDSDKVNKARFQAIPIEEAAEFMKKFKGEPKELLSSTQAQHYFQQLKAADVDETLYKRLFYRDSDKVNKARFQAIPIEEAAEFMKKFKGEPKDLLSADQASYYSGPFLKR